MNKKENRMAVRQTVEKAVIRDEQNRRIQSAATNPVKEVLKIFHTTLRGLEADTVSVNRSKYGTNKVTHEKKKSLAKRVAGAFINPFTAILFCLAFVSTITDMIFPYFSLFGSVPEDFDFLTVVIILTMVFISGTLRFVQESRSGNAAEKLLAMITTTCTVTRIGQEKTEIPMDDLVVGDIVHLSAGDMIPADVRILDAKDLFVSQASLTGESEPVEKLPHVSPHKDSVHLIFLNLIYDLSCTAIPWDNVDEEFIAKPRKWDASSVGSFMIWIGPTSSIFDFTTYIFMYFVFCPFFVSKGILFNDLPAHFSGTELTAMQTQYIGMFQAGWFVESMWSQTLVIHMIRTPKLPFIQSRASAPVTFLTMTGITILTVIPFTIFGKLLGFVALPAAYFAYLLPCILLYMVLATSLKKAYVRHFGELL